MSFKFNLDAIKNAPKLSKLSSQCLRDRYLRDSKLQDNSIFKPIFPVNANKFTEGD